MAQLPLRRTSRAGLRGLQRQCRKVGLASDCSLGVVFSFGWSLPSGSTSRSKRSRKRCRAGAVRAAGSGVRAHEEWAAIRAQRPLSGSEIGHEDTDLQEVFPRAPGGWQPSRRALQLSEASVAPGTALSTARRSSGRLCGRSRSVTLALLVRPSSFSRLRTSYRSSAHLSWRIQDIEMSLASSRRMTTSSASRASGYRSPGLRTRGSSPTTFIRLDEVTGVGPDDLERQHDAVLGTPPHHRGYGRMSLPGTRRRTRIWTFALRGSMTGCPSSSRGPGRALAARTAGARITKTGHHLWVVQVQVAAGHSRSPSDIRRCASL